jgi:hypothetical protein
MYNLYWLLSETPSSLRNIYSYDCLTYTPILPLLGPTSRALRTYLERLHGG